MKNAKKIGAVLGGVAVAAWLTMNGCALAGNLVLSEDANGDGMMYTEATTAPKHVYKQAKFSCPGLEGMLSEGICQDAAPAATPVHQDHRLASAALPTGAGDIY